MMNMGFGGLVVNSSLKTYAAGTYMILPANPRRILLSMQMTLTNVVAYYFGRPILTVPGVGETDQVSFFLWWGNNTPSDTTVSYQDRGAAMQGEVWIDLPGGISRAYITEVSIDCPYSYKWNTENPYALTVSRFYYSNVDAPNGNNLICNGNSRRVAFCALRLGGGYTDIRSGGPGIDNRINLNNSLSPPYVLTRGVFGPALDGPIYLDTFNQGAGLYFIFETLLV